MPTSVAADGCYDETALTFSVSIKW